MSAPPPVMAVLASDMDGLCGEDVEDVDDVDDVRAGGCCVGTLSGTWSYTWFMIHSMSSSVGR